MALSLSTIARTVAGQAIANLIDEGTENASGFIELRSGVKPTNADASATGDLLAVIRLSNPAIGTFVNGRAYAITTNDPDNIDKSGVPTWFRLYNRAGYCVADGTVSDTNGNGDLKLTATDFRMGGTIDLSTLAIEFPI
jgi:hypothetical protein